RCVASGLGRHSAPWRGRWPPARWSTRPRKAAGRARESGRAWDSVAVLTDPRKRCLEPEEAGGRASGLEADAGGAPMGIESLDAGKGFDVGHRLADGIAIQADDAGATLEHVYGEPGKGLARPARGQFVARSREEVSDRHGRIVAQ